VGGGKGGTKKEGGYRLGKYFGLQNWLRNRLGETDKLDKRIEPWLGDRTQVDAPRRELLRERTMTGTTALRKKGGMIPGSGVVALDLKKKKKLGKTRGGQPDGGNCQHKRRVFAAQHITKLRNQKGVAKGRVRKNETIRNLPR